MFRKRIHDPEGERIQYRQFITLTLAGFDVARSKVADWRTGDLASSLKLP